MSFADDLAQPARPGPAVGAPDPGPGAQPAERAAPDAAAGQRHRQELAAFTAAASSTRCASRAGVRFWQEQPATALARAEAEYGVPAEIIVGIIGVETIYGRDMGKFRVLDALATLAFDFPAAHPRASERSAFFKGETRTVPDAGKAAPDGDPFAALGSYAGAMGMPQFMPSSSRQIRGGLRRRRQHRPVEQPGRRDRLGRQLLQGLQLAARHAHDLPGQF